MKNFFAVTKSGAVYHCENGFLQYMGSQGYYGFKLKNMRVLSRTDMTLTGASIIALPEAELPVVGQSIFVSGTDEWRISTPIVSVTELPKDGVFTQPPPPPLTL